MNSPLSTTQTKKQNIRYPEAPPHMPVFPAGSFPEEGGAEGVGPLGTVKSANQIPP